MSLEDFGIVLNRPQYNGEEAYTSIDDPMRENDNNQIIPAREEKQKALKHNQLREAFRKKLKEMYKLDNYIDRYREYEKIIVKLRLDKDDIARAKELFSTTVMDYDSALYQVSLDKYNFYICEDCGKRLIKKDLINHASKCKITEDQELYTCMSCETKVTLENMVDHTDGCQGE